jgi:hypothetical protein
VKVEAAPAAPFKVPDPDLLFEFLIVALDASAQFGEIHQRAKADIGWKRRKPVLAPARLPFGPFYQQPLVRLACGCLMLVVGALVRMPHHAHQPINISLKSDFHYFAILRSSRSPVAIGVRFSLNETFDVGQDTGTPMLEEYEDEMPFQCTSTLARFAVFLEPYKLSDKDAAGGS